MFTCYQIQEPVNSDINVSNREIFFLEMIEIIVSLCYNIRVSDSFRVEKISLYEYDSILKNIVMYSMTSVLSP